MKVTRVTATNLSFEARAAAGGLGGEGAEAM